MPFTQTKLGRSPVTKLLDAAAADGGDISSSLIYCQRYADEQGCVQIEFNQDPVGTGEIVVEGRMDSSLPWGRVADGTTVDPVTLALIWPQLDISTYSGTVLSQIALDITILPQMRISMNNTAAIAANTTISAWIQE